MKKKIIIIGGGIVGLSAGIYSATNGFETEIIEMHNEAYNLETITQLKQN
jgi:thioredoxin reductase